MDVSEPIERPAVDELRHRVQAALRAKLPEFRRAEIIAWAAAERGFSTETYLLEVGGVVTGRPDPWSLVLRRTPDVALFPDYDLLRQVRVMNALKETDIPVPHVVTLDRNDQVLGSPYLVMEHVDSIGTVTDVPSHHSSGMYAEVDEAGRSKMWTGLIETLVAVHRLDWQALDLGWMTSAEPGSNPLEPLVAYLERTLPWAHAMHGDKLAAALTFLREEMPSPEHVVLCWGDARLSNLLFSSELEVAAVLDWEISFIGPHECDLAWALFLEWAATTQQGIEPLPGTPTRGEIIEMYESKGGLPVRNLKYYEVLAAVLLSIPILRLATKFGVEDPVDFIGFCSVRVGELLDQQ